MSKYTTEVRFICESYAGAEVSVGLNGVDNIIEKARSKVFDFNYPIFDEAYRSVLETKILKHFYTREIGAETVGLWKLWLNTRLNEIMPYYNQLYKSELLEFNPLYEIDITREQTRKADGTKKDTGAITGEATSKNNNYYSDTPQGGVGDLENHDYLTSATLDSGNSTTNTSSVIDSVINNTEEYLERVSGKQSSTSYAKLLKEYREAFINIDVMVIDELKDLFLNLW